MPRAERVRGAVRAGHVSRSATVSARRIIPSASTSRPLGVSLDEPKIHRPSGMEAVPITSSGQRPAERRHAGAIEDRVSDPAQHVGRGRDRRDRLHPARQETTPGSRRRRPAAGDPGRRSRSPRRAPGDQRQDGGHHADAEERDGADDEHDSAERVRVRQTRRKKRPQRRTGGSPGRCRRRREEAVPTEVRRRGRPATSSCTRSSPPSAPRRPSR